MNTAHLLSAVLEKYRTCNSYSDRGTVTLSWFNQAGAETISPEEVDFATWFDRAAHFRIEFRQRRCPSVADLVHLDHLHNKGRKYVGFGNAYMLTEDNVETIVNLARTRSGGSTTTIASLLGLECELLFAPGSIKNFVMLEDNVLNSINCAHILNVNLEGQRAELWISAHDFKIWKISLCEIPDKYLKSSTLPTFYSGSTYRTYRFHNVELNGNLSRESFQLPNAENVLSEEELDIYSAIEGFGPLKKKRTLAEAAVFCGTTVSEATRIFESATNKVGW